jgi:hypothetical protein
MNNFGTMHPVSQLELEGFGQSLLTADGASEGTPLTAAQIREFEMAARKSLKDLLTGGDMPSWAERFNDMLNNGVPWKIAAFVAWSTVPRDKRWPETQEKLAVEVLGLKSDRQISEWRKKYPMIDMMIANLQSQEFLEDRADVLYALKTMAKRLDYKAAKDRENYLTMTGDLVKTTKLEAALRKMGVSKDDLADMSDDQLNALSVTIKNQLTEQAEEAAGSTPEAE